ncbi:YhbP family protein [Pantoea sp. Nvir]|uniref:YhbP family protein n=1 Tax=Pantoea sp. Nvir TaxID=2576760 RepID=UPI0013587735|nr:YhbP family protein [Pantoea sp. Nvir]MXP66422.1 hypothetical protein [Pantoea sp. Nvir]
MSNHGHLVRYLKKQHVLSLCCHSASDLWCANCFYIFGEVRMVFWLMTEHHTRHGILLQSNSQVAGTVNSQPKTVLLIKGIQYSGTIVSLKGDTEEQVRRLYQKYFSVAHKVSAPLWEIRLDKIKMTDNSLGFGKKIFWQREER